MLNGRSAIVTGSTSGIGLGIARALAADGANVMLNGFGNAAEMEKLCFSLAKEFNVKVAFSGLAVFLCSESASQIRGAAITVDGGWTAQ